MVTVFALTDGMVLHANGQEDSHRGGSSHFRRMLAICLSDWTGKWRAMKAKRC